AVMVLMPALAPGWSGAGRHAPSIIPQPQMLTRLTLAAMLHVVAGNMAPPTTVRRAFTRPLAGANHVVRHAPARPDAPALAHGAAPDRRRLPHGRRACRVPRRHDAGPPDDRRRARMAE